MASPLTVIPAATGAARAFGAGGPAAEEAAEAFAALLGAGEPAITTTGTATRQSEGGPGLDLASLVTMALGFGGAGAESDKDEPESGDAVAAIVGTPLQPITDPALKDRLVELTEALGAVKTALDAGEPLPPELMDKLGSLLADLSDMLDVDLDSISPAPLLPDSIPAPAPGASLAQQLAAALAPLAEGVTAAAAAQPDVASIDAAGRLATQLTTLAKVLAGQGGDTVELPDALTTPALPDSELDAAIARLLQPDEPVAVPAEPELAAPALKLTEPVLTGQAAAATAADADTSTIDTASADPVTAAPDAEPAADPEPETQPEQPAARPHRRAEASAASTAAPPADQAPTPATPAGTTDTAVRIDGAAQPRVVQAGYQTSQQQLNLPQLAFELVRQVNDGNTRFQIRLDPPELGKIDVRLDIDRAGQVTARLTVEKAETLDLMQRDQRGLERALQQAGLDGQKTNLEFSLKQNPFAGQGQQGQEQGQGRGYAAPAPEAADEPVLPTVTLYRGSLTASGVNIIA